MEKKSGGNSNKIGAYSWPNGEGKLVGLNDEYTINQLADAVFPGLKDDSDSYKYLIDVKYDAAASCIKCDKTLNKCSFYTLLWDDLTYTKGPIHLSEGKEGKIRITSKEVSLGYAAEYNRLTNEFRGGKTIQSCSLIKEVNEEAYKINLEVIEEKKTLDQGIAELQAWVKNKYNIAASAIFVYGGGPESSISKDEKTLAGFNFNIQKSETESKSTYDLLIKSSLDSEGASIVCKGDMCKSIHVLFTWPTTDEHYSHMYGGDIIKLINHYRTTNGGSLVTYKKHANDAVYSTC
jgi:hypothetical protein